MLRYSTPEIEISKFPRLDILTECWKGEGGDDQDPGDGTKPGWPTEGGSPGSILDLIFRG